MKWAVKVDGGGAVPNSLPFQEYCVKECQRLWRGVSPFARKALRWLELNEECEVHLVTLGAWVTGAGDAGLLRRRGLLCLRLALNDMARELGYRSWKAAGTEKADLVRRYNAELGG
jgi:hypothetical protein